MQGRWIGRAGDHLVAIAIAAAFAVRCVFVVTRPSEIGDWILYRNVAGNILRGCGVAVTIPGVGECVPHFGGNMLPLYPAFAAAVWAVAGHSNLAIMLAQSLLAALSVGYCVHAVRRLTASRLAAGLAGAILAVSPFTVVFAGKLLTETLAVAAAQWVFAELLLSLAQRRVRTLPLAAAIAVSAWVRMDGVLLLALLPTLAWHLARPGRGRLLRAARPSVAIGAIVAASCLLWSVRNVAVGLPPLPQPWVKTDGTYWPRGYTDWVTTWAVGQQERGNALYYDLRDPRHALSDAAFRTPAERGLVTRLVAETRATPGTSIPPRIDAAFAALAADREASLSPADRLARFWGRLRAVSGRWFWPWRHGVGDGRDWNTPSDAYRFALILVALGALAAGLRNRRAELAIPAACALLYLAVRAVFFAATANTELRYTIEAAPMLELTAALALAAAVRAGLPRLTRRRLPRLPSAPDRRRLTEAG